MEAGTQRLRRGLTLTQRLALSLTVGAFFVALVLGFLSATRANQRAIQDAAVAESEMAASLSERSAPLLDRGDIMRLSVLATVARDQIGGRILLLDRGGRVVIDTALVLGERQLSLLAGSGTFQRTTIRAGSEPGEPRAQRETLAPIRFGGEIIGELRIQCDVVDSSDVFDFAWFGLVLLSCLTLVVVAVIFGHHWATGVRRATDSLIRLSVGEVGEAGEIESGEGDSDLEELCTALREMERGVQDGLVLVSEGFAAMAQQLVDNLERHRVAPPGHGARTERFGARLADRLQLVEADRADLALACRMVDLGKAWVRPAILQKQGALTEAELASLRQHPVRGAEALSAMPALRRAAEFVRHQGERYDGSGWPDRLRGDRIPLGARIVAIAAAFDLLTTCAAERPLSWDQALEQLNRARGEAFDPWLLDLFAEEIRKQPPDAVADSSVMIVPCGNVPWQDDLRSGDDEDDDDEPVIDELEVLADEDAGEEVPLIRRLLPALLLWLCRAAGSLHAGARALLAQDLPTALVEFDAVPVTHERYPEARATAMSVERRMRRAHELMLEALLLRSEWKDLDALAVLHRARAVWPLMPGIASLITATESRSAMLGEGEEVPVGRPPVIVPILSQPTTVDSPVAPPLATPVDSPTGPWPIVAEAIETPAPDEPTAWRRSVETPTAPVEVETVEPPIAVETLPAPGSSGPVGPPRPAWSAVQPPVAESPESETVAEPIVPEPSMARPLPGAVATRVAGHEDPVAPGLVAVETRLGRGDFELAVVDLIELSKRFPRDARVRLRLARVLHQRALMRYGHGQLAAAIADWDRVVVLDSTNVLARSLLQAAQAEASPAMPPR